MRVPMRFPIIEHNLACYDGPRYPGAKPKRAQRMSISVTFITLSPDKMCETPA